MIEPKHPDATAPDDIADKLVEPEEPGWFERLGIRYFHKLAAQEHDRYDLARDDDQMAAMVRQVTWINAFWAFAIGALSAGATVFTEEYFRPVYLPETVTDHPLINQVWLYSWVGGVTAIMTGAEFVVLFLVSIRAVFFIARITGHNRLHLENAQPGVSIPNLLSRAALEIPDPVRHVLGIDPLARVSRRRMILIGLLYKLKIFASNVLGKLILKRFVGKGVLRVSAAWISVPITGFWNGFVVWKVAREARMRLFGNLLANYLVTEVITPAKMARLSERARMGCIRAIGNSVVLTQNAHPNMIILMIQLCKVFQIQEGDHLDSWDHFLADLESVAEHERFFILDLLSISTAFDGKLSRLERKTLPEAFGEHTVVYMQRIRKLSDLMHKGRLHAARELCDLDFEAG
ncbi:MAG: hypothetical protein KDK39_16175 [Leptospiraceae bacterium]|nr:hypothetical protein [Leptospiraceae bacterium]